MDTSEAKHHIRRYDALLSIKRDMEAELDDIERFIDPIRGGKFYSPETSQFETEWDRSEIFDGTARKSLIDLSSSMASYLTNPSIKWFDLTFRDQDLNTNSEAKEWLEECGKRIYQALNDSNFTGEMAKFYLDLCAYGTAFNIEEVENELQYDGINFSAIPIRECFFEPSHEGKVNRFYRRLQWHPLQIMTKFGASNVPANIQGEAADGSLDTKHDVIFCVWEREEYKEITEDRPLVSPKERQWGWAYILHNDYHIFDEGGYYEMPVYAVKWEEASGNDWGFGPGHIALPTVRGVNELRRLMKARTAKEIDPILATQKNNIVGDINWNAGEVHVFKDIEKMKYVSPEGNFSIAIEDLERDQMFIRQVFFNDDLFLKDSPAMTATEVMERTERLIKLLGGTFGRLQAGMLDPTIERTFNILFRAGQLPEMPDVVSEGGLDDALDINYTGALARSQKSEEALATSRWLNELMIQAELRPDVLDLPDWDELNRGQAIQLGVPTKYVKGQEDVDKDREARQEAEDKAREAAIAQAQGDAAKAVGEGQASLRAVGGNE